MTRPDPEVINQDRIYATVTYETLAKRVEQVIIKSEQNEDGSFALAAMEGFAPRAGPSRMGLPAIMPKDQIRKALHLCDVRA